MGNCRLRRSSLARRPSGRPAGARDCVRPAGGGLCAARGTQLDATANPLGPVSVCGRVSLRAAGLLLCTRNDARKLVDRSGPLWPPPHNTLAHTHRARQNTASVQPALPTSSPVQGCCPICRRSPFSPSLLASQSPLFRPQSTAGPLPASPPLTLGRPTARAVRPLGGGRAPLPARRGAPLGCSFWLACHRPARVAKGASSFFEASRKSYQSRQNCAQ